MTWKKLKEVKMLIETSSFPPRPIRRVNGSQMTHVVALSACILWILLVWCALYYFIMIRRCRFVCRVINKTLSTRIGALTVWETHTCPTNGLTIPTFCKFEQDTTFMTHIEEVLIYI